MDPPVIELSQYRSPPPPPRQDGVLSGGLSTFATIHEIHEIDNLSHNSQNQPIPISAYVYLPKLQSTESTYACPGYSPQDWPS